MRLTIVTPTLSRRGGTEKCLAWLVEDLSRLTDVSVWCGRVDDVDTSRTRLLRLPIIQHPRLLRYVSFLAANWLSMAARRSHAGVESDLVVATAGDCLRSNVVYAHFCCAAWLEMVRGGGAHLPAVTLRQRLRNWHYVTFLSLASLVERMIYASPTVRAVIAVSQGTKRELVHYYGVPPERITVVPNAVDERVQISPDLREAYRTSVRNRFGIAADVTVLLFVAAGDWKRKGFLLVLEALALLNRPGAHLLVVGKEDLAYYEARARELGVEAQVTFCGFVADVERYYAAADVFVYPSSYEAFSLVSLEACGAGLPLVVTRINGTDELVRDGENGFFVRADAHDIQSVLGRLMDDPALVRRMSAAAVEAARRYARPAVAQQVLAVCEEAAGPAIITDESGGTAA